MYVYAFFFLYIRNAGSGTCQSTTINTNNAGPNGDLGVSTITLDTENPNLSSNRLEMVFVWVNGTDAETLLRSNAIVYASFSYDRYIYIVIEYVLLSPGILDTFFKASIDKKM